MPFSAIQKHRGDWITLVANKRRGFLRDEDKDPCTKHQWRSIAKRVLALHLGDSNAKIKSSLLCRAVRLQMNVDKELI